MSDSLTIGQNGERHACDYLKSQGLTLLTKNYRKHKGEIDLIMKDGTYCVFVEVRLRKKEHYGTSIETITPTKQALIIRTAKHFLLEQNLYDKVDCRFDVVGIDKQNHLTWIRNAFWPADG